MKQTIKTAFQTVAIKALTTIERVQTGVAFNPLTPEFREDPYRCYRQLLEKDPIHRSKLLGGSIVTRYRDIEAILRDPRFGSDDRTRPAYQKNLERGMEEGILESPDDGFTGSMLRSDPPDIHRSVRVRTGLVAAHIAQPHACELECRTGDRHFCSRVRPRIV